MAVRLPNARAPMGQGVSNAFGTLGGFLGQLFAQQQLQQQQQGLNAQQQAATLQTEVSRLLADPDTPDDMRAQAEQLQAQLSQALLGTPEQALTLMQGLNIPVQTTTTQAAPGLQRNPVPQGVPSFFGATGAKPTQEVTTTEQVTPFSFLSRLGRAEAQGQQTREQQDAANQRIRSLFDAALPTIFSGQMDPAMARTLADQMSLAPDAFTDQERAIVNGIVQNVPAFTVSDLEAMPADIRAQNLAAFERDGQLSPDAPQAYREYVEQNPGWLEQVKVYQDKRAADALGLESAELGIDLQTASLEQTQQAIEQQGFQNVASRTDYVFTTGSRGLYDKLSPDQQRIVDARLRAAGVTLEDRAKAYYDTLRADEELKQQAVSLGQQQLEAGDRNIRLLDYQLGTQEYLASRRPIEAFIQDVEAMDGIVGRAVANGDTERVQGFINTLESGDVNNVAYQSLTNAGYTAEGLRADLADAQGNDAYQERERQLKMAQLDAALDLLPVTTAANRAQARMTAIDSLASVFTPEQIQDYWDNQLSTVEREALGETALFAAQNRADVRLTLQQQELDAPAVESAISLLDLYLQQRPANTEQGLNAVYGALGTLADANLLERDDIDGVANFYTQAWGDQAEAFNADMATSTWNTLYNKIRTQQLLMGENPDDAQEQRYRLDSMVSLLKSESNILGCGTINSTNPERCNAITEEMAALLDEYKVLGGFVPAPDTDAPDADVSLEGVNTEGLTDEQLGELRQAAANPASTPDSLNALAAAMRGDAAPTTTTPGFFSPEAAQGRREGTRGFFRGIFQGLGAPVASEPQPAASRTPQGGNLVPREPRTFQGVDVSPILNDSRFQALLSNPTMPGLQRQGAITALASAHGVDAELVRDLLEIERTQLGATR